jgi:predicted kinase
MLIIFNGLPGSGKSTVAKLLSQKINGMYLRVDTVEQAIRSASEQNKKLALRVILFFMSWRVKIYS